MVNQPIFNIRGMEEHAFSLWSLSGATKVHDHIINMFEQAAREKDPQREEILTLCSRRRWIYRRGIDG